MDPAGRAVAYGDPLADGRFRVLLRDPATARWRVAPSAPAALASGEAAFAASGTGIRLDGARAVFVTGANDGTARAMISEDRAESWSAASIPMPAPKPASGAFSLALDGEGRGVAVGGDFTARERGGTRVRGLHRGRRRDLGRADGRTEGSARGIVRPRRRRLPRDRPDRHRHQP